MQNQLSGIKRELKKKKILIYGSWGYKIVNFQKQTQMNVNTVDY